MSLKKSIATSFAKKTITSLFLTGLAVFAIASMGGGGNKSKNKTVKVDVTPIRTTNGFTLRSGVNYHGSMIFGQERSNSLISYNSVVTYQKGNTTYILPYRYRLQTNVLPKSSLQTFNLKLKIHK